MIVAIIYQFNPAANIQKNADSAGFSKLFSAESVFFYQIPLDI